MIITGVLTLTIAVIVLVKVLCDGHGPAMVKVLRPPAAAGPAGPAGPTVHRSDVSSLTISYDKMQTKYNPALTCLTQKLFWIPKNYLGSRVRLTVS